MVSAKHLMPQLKGFELISPYYLVNRDDCIKRNPNIWSNSLDCQEQRPSYVDRDEEKRGYDQGPKKV